MLPDAMDLVIKVIGKEEMNQKLISVEIENSK